MNYNKIFIPCDTELAEILIAVLSEAGYEGFLEREDGLEVYADEEHFSLEFFTKTIAQYLPDPSFSVEVLEKKNWNEEWEKNYQPVIVENHCLIRTPFHQLSQSFPLEIIIIPKMSFGTGHHATTYMMVQHLLTFNLESKRVLDAGCGTAILSIVAEKKGGEEIVAFDVDPWCIENGQENISLNDCHRIQLQLGSTDEMNYTVPFDLILANINKNILLKAMGNFAAHLNPEGSLLLSGFYGHDRLDLTDLASHYGLVQVGGMERDLWATLWFKKA